MLTLLGSLLGFGTSIFPSILDFFKEGRDQKHELQVMEMQIQVQKELHTQKLEALNVEADIREFEAMQRSQAQTTGTWVDALSKSVRPIITYLMFALFAFVKVKAAILIYQQSGTIDAAVLADVWDQETRAIFAAIISFWFGNRTFQKMRGR